MTHKYTEGQKVMIMVRGYEPREGMVKTVSIGGHKGNENVYWVTFESSKKVGNREFGLWFSERELQPTEVIDDK